MALMGGIRLDNFTVPQPFAMDEPSRLSGHMVMGAQGLAPLRSQALAPGRTAMLGTVRSLWRLGA
jgi:hypothetical protein